MDWKQILEIVDDDYLVGISNKGILKRAYKDREAIAELPYLDNQGEQLVISVGEETVQIANPLGESKCTCPSRSICRHIVLGILLAKEIFKKDTGQEEIKFSENSENIENTLQNQVLQEIREYPKKRLFRVMNTKAISSLLEHIKIGQEPEIQYSSMITVKLQEGEMLVKLLSPLEHSTCSCHKKELCVHKAEAILWCQWKEKILSVEELEKEVEQVFDYDKEQITEVARQIKAYLEELFSMGLCRTSMDVVNTLERLAIMAHNAQLPKVENQLRSLADSYSRYLRRSSSFSIDAAMRCFFSLYEDSLELLSVKSNSEIKQLAGEFHGKYHLEGNLELIAVTLEHFVSKSGYEGDTIYFIEKHTRKWYNYTNARPTFYDKKIYKGKLQKAVAPWGLPLSLETMVGCQLRLQGAKCDEIGRLSSSQETRAEVLGNAVLTEELLRDCYFRDFAKAFSEKIVFEENGDGKQSQELIFLQPSKIERAKFDEIQQVLRMPLWDENAKLVTVEIPYSKRMEQTIRYLEKLEEDSLPCFVGRLYLKESKLQFYPVDIFKKKELSWSCMGLEAAEDIAPDEDKMTPQDVIFSILEAIEGIFEDFFQVGIDTVSESLWKHLKEGGNKAQLYGMEVFAKGIFYLTDELERGRHQIEKAQAEILLPVYRILYDYMSLAKRKTMYDKAKCYYDEKC